MTRRAKIAIVAVLAALGCATVAVSWRIAADWGVLEAEGVAADRARFYATNLSAELKRAEHIPFILARDSHVIAAAETGETDRLNRRLETFARSAGVDALYLMTPSGLTIAASNWRSPGGGFVGRYYDFRSYFKSALNGERGALFAVGATTGEPGWFYAEAVRGADGAAIGVMAAKVDLRPLERAWREGGEIVIVADAQGILALSSRPEWLYLTLAELPGLVEKEIRATRQYGDAPLEQLSESPITLTEGPAVIEIDGTRYVRGDAPATRGGFTVIYLSPYDAAVSGAARSASIAAAILLGLAALAAALRSERIRAALLQSQRQTMELSALNTALEDEINQRRAAELRLQSAQKELAERSKLEALGQLSAAVNHELSQPLAAMKTYIAAVKRREGSDRAPSNAFDLESLVDRMIRITRQMKLFARRPSEPPEPIDVNEAIRSAVNAMRPLLTEGGVDVVVAETETPTARIEQLRLEQVLVNLISNAADAMDESPVRRLRISSRTERLEADAEAVIQVEDTGPGVSEDSKARIFEPFFSTKASGEGLGLGLALSAQILEDAKGRIIARNGDEGGAVFEIRLPCGSKAELELVS